MHETCRCGGIKPFKKSRRLTYSDQLQETGVKREIMVNWGGSEVKRLLLPAEQEVN